MTNPEFAKPEDYPAPLAETLSETEQAFANFVIRNSVETDINYVDAYDIRQGELSCDANGLIPVDTIDVFSMVVVKDENDESLQNPYILRQIELKNNILGVIMNVKHSSQNGWRIAIADYEGYDVDEAYASRMIDSILDFEREALS